MTADPAVAAIRHLYHHCSDTADPKSCAQCREALALLSVPDRVEEDRRMVGEWVRRQAAGPRGRLRLIRQPDESHEGRRWLNNLLHQTDHAPMT